MKHRFSSEADRTSEKITPPHVHPDASELIFIIDTREQIPWSLSGSKVLKASLKTGDYSLGFPYKNRLRVLDKIFAVERKATVSDLLNCMGNDRERFEEELDRLGRVWRRLVICEFTLEELLIAPSGVNIESRIGSILAWQQKHCIPFLFAGTRAAGEQAFVRFALQFWHEVFATRTLRVEKEKISDSTTDQESI